MIPFKSLFIHMEFGTNSEQIEQGGTVILPHLSIPRFPTHTQLINPDPQMVSDHFAFRDPWLVILPRLLKKMKEMQCQCHCIYDIPRHVTMEYVWDLSSRIFQSHVDVTIAGEGPRLLWHRASVYIMVISEYPWHSHLLPSV